MNAFEEWFLDNEEYLESNKISKRTAEVIWNSAKTSAIHDLLSMVQDGKVTLSFQE